MGTDDTPDTPERRTGGDRRAVSVDDRLDEIERGYKLRYQQNRALIQKLTRWTFRILAVLVVVQLAFGVVSVKLLVSNSKQNDDIAAAVEAIQGQRAESVWDACRSQNYRHDNTVARLHAVVDKIKNPERRARAERNTAATTSLIDALTPPQDCVTALALRLHLSGLPLRRLAAKLVREIGPQRPPQTP